jgi:hypothetical protein
MIALDDYQKTKSLLDSAMQELSKKEDIVSEFETEI